MRDKIETFIGFSIKSRKAVYGLDSVIRYRKKMHCFLICKTVSENTEKEVLKLAQKYDLPLIKTVEKTLSEITFLDNCKVLALTNKELSKAVLDNLNSGYMLVNRIKSTDAD